MVAVTHLVQRFVSAAVMVLLAVAGPAQAPPPSPAGDDFVFAHENVLGTSLRMCVSAGNEHDAHDLEQDVLREIERLARVVSTWDEDSELRRALAATKPVVLSEELAEVVAACDHWRARTRGVFEPGIATLAAIWRHGAETGAEPDDRALADAVAALAEPAWSFDAATRRFQVRPGAAVTVDALAKGYVIEKASAVRREHASVRVLEIGGDLRVRAESPRAVSIADPRHPADNAAPMAVVWVRDAAVASSGGYARGFDVGTVHHSHLLDPRTGRPCDEVLGTSVVASDATTADALATIMAVLGADDGIGFVDGIDGAAGVVVTRDGKVRESKAWRQYVDAKPDGVPTAATPTPAASPWPAGFEFTVALEIRGPDANAQGGRRRGGYRRPYVAVWIESPSGTAVRTLALWAEQPRWLSDLRRWYKQYRRDNDYIDAISRATRKPGKYTLAWDGLDDYGDPVKPGDYVLCIEAAREHGTYQSMRQPIKLGVDAFEHTLEGNQEIAGAGVHFGRGEPK